MGEEISSWACFCEIKVASWHIRTVPHKTPSTCEQICPYSHQNLADKQPTWKLTLRWQVECEVLNPQLLVSLYLNHRLCLNYEIDLYMDLSLALKTHLTKPKFHGLRNLVHMEYSQDTVKVKALTYKPAVLYKVCCLYVCKHLELSIKSRREGPNQTRSLVPL